MPNRFALMEQKIKEKRELTNRTVTNPEARAAILKKLDEQEKALVELKSLPKPS